MSPEKRKQLKAKAHTIKPVVMIGQHGLTEAVLNEIDIALNAHELIKIKTPAGDSKDRRQLCSDICAQLGAQEVQVVGRNITIHRQQTDH
jgi:RNA-binding protein